MLVRNGHVDSVVLVSGAPLHTTHITAGADQRVPDETSGLRVENDIDAALLADTDDGALAPAAANLEDVRPGTTEVPFVAPIEWVVGFRGAPGDLRRLRGARSLPRVVADDPVRPNSG